MREELLHFIWQSKVLQGQQLFTTEGEKISIIRQGLYNKDAGPDFMNVRLKIGQTEWGGNMEMHVHSSEWITHKHHTDKAYDNVVLHVVYHHDKEIIDRYGRIIPTLELREYIPPALLAKYEYLQKQQHTIACEKVFCLPDEHKTNMWLERLLIERLENKCGLLNDLLVRTNQNWEQSFYVLTARYFGMKTNSQPFEWLAERLPLLVLAKHKNSLKQLEALLYGTAGLLEKNQDAELTQEFQFLQKKYQLDPLPEHVWKFSQTRPANFPTVRIKQFAALIFHSSLLFSKILEASTVKELEQLYTFKTGNRTTLSKSAIQLILINSVLPALFVYGQKQHKPALAERCLQFYAQIEPEENNIIRFWRKLGITSQSSAQAQALLQLKTYYCDQLNCLHCTFGQNILLNE